MIIQIDYHTQLRAAERWTNKREIVDVIRNGFEIKTKYHNREGRAKIYKYGKKRNNKFYKQKRVEVYYIEEENKIITITVYVFYGEWRK